MPSRGEVVPGVVPCAAALVLAAGLAQGSGVTVLALEGGDAPGGQGRLWSFFEPVIDDADRVLYLARVGSSSVQTDNAYVVQSGGEPRIALLEGDGVPEGAGRFETFSENPAVNGSGVAVFHASLDDATSTTDSGLYAVDLESGVVTELAREGSPTPAGGLFGRFTVSINSPRLNTVNASGASVFVEDLFGDGVTSDRDFAAFFADGASVGLIAAEGDVVPSFQQGAGPVDTLIYATLNDAGEAAFTAELSGVFGDEGVYRWSGGSVTALATVGEPTPTGGVYDEFTTVLYTPINNAGEVAFRVFVELGVGGNPGMVFRAGSSGTTLIARRGDPIPGTDDTISSISRDLALNNAGQVLLEANDGPNGDRFLVLGDGVSQTFIAVPGTASPCGDLFDGTIYEYALNDAGQVAFTARTEDPAQGSSSWRRGLYLYTPGEGTACLLRVGDQLEGLTVSDIDLRPVDEAGSMRADGLSASGAVAFRFDTVERLNGIAAFGLPAPCNQADLAEPFGLLDLADITGFASAFLSGSDSADLDGSGLLDLADITAFVTAFLGGCP